MKGQVLKKGCAFQLVACDEKVMSYDDGWDKLLDAFETWQSLWVDKLTLVNLCSFGSTQTNA